VLGWRGGFTGRYSEFTLDHNEDGGMVEKDVRKLYTASAILYQEGYKEIYNEDEREVFWDASKRIDEAINILKGPNG
jgi:hypothetical protein